jgi:hypothetical protein
MGSSPNAVYRDRMGNCGAAPTRPSAAISGQRFASHIISGQVKEAVEEIRALAPCLRYRHTLSCFCNWEKFRPTTLYNNSFHLDVGFWEGDWKIYTFCVGRLTTPLAYSQNIDFSYFPLF